VIRERACSAPLFEDVAQHRFAAHLSQRDVACMVHSVWPVLANLPSQCNAGCERAQGPDTDRRAVSEIREAVKTGTETSVRLLNYKKNGQPFWNLFTLAPMADVDGNLRFIIGVQV